MSNVTETDSVLTKSNIMSCCNSFIAPAAFKLKDKKKKTTTSTSPFSTNRQYNIKTGSGIQIKKSDKELTKFIEGPSREGSLWKVNICYANISKEIYITYILTTCHEQFFLVYKIPKNTLKTAHTSKYHGLWLYAIKGC